MNYYMIQKTVKDFGPIAMKFIAANKDTIIKILPYGACAGLRGYGAYKSNEQKEKDRLYQKHIEKADAIISDLEKKAEKVDKLETINEVLVDALVKYKHTEFAEA